MPTSPLDIQAQHHELAAACNWMAGICGPHQLDASHPEHLSFEHSGARLPGRATVLGCISYGTAVNIGIQGLDAYSLSLPIEGRQQLSSGGAQVRSHAQLGVVVAPFGRQQLAMADDCRKLQVVVRQQTMREVAESLLQRPLAEPVRFALEMDLRHAKVQAWWEMVRQLLASWPAVSALYGHAPLAGEFEALLIKGLLLAQPNNYSDELLASPGQPVPQYLERARRYLRRNAGEAIRLADVEAASGVSRGKLFDAFARHHGQTPMAWLKHYRLRQARSALLTGPASANISQLALAWGFGHLGRFASDYRKAFGETPSQTLARLRP
ncbi:helix-turn-helix domain-containing protein [Pseudomonas sp. NPDC007930]|uniref:AraC family transcriptional regulator n=1 Tax=Pseudomonas sp. NPDC007930 TaxID=3364417 RepID=UPI0036EFD163